MIRKIFLFTTVILSSILIISCVSSKKLLQRGDYYRATMEAVKTLRSNPKNKKAIKVLSQAYPLAVNNSTRIIDNAIATNNVNKNIIIADEYLALNDLANSIFKCPKALEIIPQPNQYSNELRKYLPLAAETAYNKGLELLRTKSINDARQAYILFTKTDRYVNGYKDVKNKIEEAIFYATLKVLVKKPQTPARYQLTADFFYNNLMASFSDQSKYQFIRFYTYQEARNENLQSPDQYLVLNFEDFSVGNLREFSKETEVKKDSVKVGTTTISGVQHDVYGTVNAKVTTRRREVISEGVLSVQIINANNNRIEEHRNFPGKFVWVNEWLTYRGDERALSEEQKRLSNIEPIMPPPQQDLFIEFTKPIFDQTVSFVKNYYNEKEKYLSNY